MNNLVGLWITCQIYTDVYVENKGWKQNSEYE
jgi:hypothetical protein